jgi:ribosomal protein S12 methylthiotransferase accessory factor
VVWSHVENSGRTQEEALLENPGLVGSRTIEPNRTWELHRHVVSDLIGIVPIIEPVGPAELNAFAAGANVVGIDDPAVAASALRNRGGGKGLSPEAARASALAEAIERDALRARGDEPVIVGGMDEIPGAIHPNDIQLFSDRQLADADARWDAGTAITSGFHIVPRPFDTERPREWSAVRSLVTGELHYLPTSKLFVRAKRQAGDPSCSSNGAAAGNTLAEAQ